MLRTLRLVIGAAVVLATSSVLAQPPAGDSYYPLKPKTKWVYKVGDQTVEVEVAGTEKVGNEEATKVVTKVNGKEVASELYQAKPDGIYRLKVKDEKIEPAVKVLALPVKKDNAWKIDSKVGSQTVKGEFKVKNDKEEVTVPAGKFEAVLVEGTDLDVAGTKTTVRQWFAKDKGIVKLEYVIQGTQSLLELKEYTEGK
jgi:hypothetical protein